MTENKGSSRRDFVANTARLASAAALSGCIPGPQTLSAAPAPTPVARGDWDLSWLGLIGNATDRAVFDWPNLGDPADPIVPEHVERYLDNCAAAYADHAYRAIVVLNIRTTAIPAAFNDAAWARYQLGREYTVKDPATSELAVRNPFWTRRQATPTAAQPAFHYPTLEQLEARNTIILVCDFAMGHLATRLAGKAGRPADEVHADLRRSLVPNGYAVPSGIFGLIRAQNAGCGFMRV